MYNTHYEALAKLLNIIPNYLSFEPAVSRNSDYRFTGVRQSTTMFCKPEALVFLLPKKNARRQLTECLMKEAENALKRCVTNILSDDRYRLKESLRGFQAAFRQDADSLTKTLTALQNTLADRQTGTATQQAAVKNELAEKIRSVSALL